jgi:uncharacterized protein (DUF433 family)
VTADYLAAATFGGVLVLACWLSVIRARVKRLEAAQWLKVEVRATTDDIRDPYVVFPFDGHTEPLEPFLAHHDANLAAAVWVHPERYGGRPCIGGHRIAVDDAVNIADANPNGYLADEYGITAEQTAVARWFVDNYPTHPYTAEDLDPGTLTARNVAGGVVSDQNGAFVTVIVADAATAPRRNTSVVLVEVEAIDVPNDDGHIEPWYPPDVAP